MRKNLKREVTDKEKWDFGEKKSGITLKHNLPSNLQKCTNIVLNKQRDTGSE